MSITTHVIIENAEIKVVQFLWSNPISAGSLQDREIIDAALEKAINEYVTDNNYLLYSAHKNPLLRLISRIVIIKDSFDYPEIETK
jgi:hypothetical protein